MSSAAIVLPDIERRRLRALAGADTVRRPAARGRLPAHHAERVGAEQGRLPPRSRWRGYQARISFDDEPGFTC